jgi:hypothetical protein
MLVAGLGAGSGSGSGSTSGSHKPEVKTLPPTQVGIDHGTLQGKVRPLLASTTYSFEYGTTTDYGQATVATPVAHGSDSGSDDSDDWASVAKTIEGLAPSTTYHFRVVATNADGTVQGEDKFFTTADADGTSNGHGGGEGSDDRAHAEKPELGKSVGVDPADGVVRVRKPKDKRFGALEPGHTVPAGTIIDARFGTVTLTTAVTQGKTQTATFWGGAFEVRPSRDGYTDIHLRGFPPSGCPAKGAKRHLAVASARRRARRLWGRDSHGRFRTHGRNSVATVRGTQWLTTERCNGTLTFVREGTVDVRDARGRSVAVRAGHSFLARPRG